MTTLTRYYVRFEKPPKFKFQKPVPTKTATATYNGKTANVFQKPESIDRKYNNNNNNKRKQFGNAINS